MTPAVGETVAGRYELQAQIGSGGFATVWRAHDTDGDRDVAVKLADESTHDSDAVAARFEREAETLGRFEGAITPAGVVRYLDGDVRAGQPYVVLEYLPGEPLNEAIASGTLGTSVRERIVADLAATFDFLHRNGVVYLDCKPENVILRDSGRPVIIDFNTAVTTDEDIETRFEVDQYKPPELLPAVDGGGDPGPASDVFAWGKLAFYLFTGAKVLPDDVPPDGVNPLDFGGSCSRALAEVVQRATRPDPTERYADGMAVATAHARATRRGPRALLTHLPTDVTCPLLDGQVMGRLDETQEVPWVVLPDHGQHVSPHHARLDATTDGWRLTDTSLNGTYVGSPDDWTFLISAEGFRTRQERGQAGPDDEQPQSAARVHTNTQIRPVHPTYGIDLRFETTD